MGLPWQQSSHMSPRSRHSYYKRSQCVMYVSHTYFFCTVYGLTDERVLQEVKQCKEECGIVMGNLDRIARIIVNFGELCEKSNMNENDLPPSLRAILDRLQRFVFGDCCASWPSQSDE